ncbi:MAG: Yip1 family protein [Alphaproteobacteria bacterium]
MNLTERVKNILLQPAAEWAVIAQETGNASELYKSYIAPLAAIGPIASIIGFAVIGVPLPMGGSYRAPLTSAIGQAVITFILVLAGTYVLALIIDALAPTFGGTKDNFQALKVAAYSSTAAWVAGIFNLIPALAFLQILALYSIYLLYLGLPILMKAPKEKALSYTGVVIIAAIVIFGIIGVIGSCFIPHPVYR